MLDESIMNEFSSPHIEALRAAYAAFNARDIDAGRCLAACV